MSGYLAAAAVGCALVLQSVGYSQSPQATKIRDSLGCKDCRIESQLIVDLSSSLKLLDANGSFPAGVRVDSKGRYRVLGIGQPQVFSPQGQRLAIPQGDAVQNIRAPSTVISLPGDSVLLLDPGIGNALLFDPFLRYVRSIAFDIPATSGVVINWPSRVVMNGNIPTPDAAGFPLHEISFASNRAAVVRSFASEEATLLVGGGNNMSPDLSEDPLGGFWTADVSRFRLTKWTSATKPVESIERLSEWFTPTAIATLGGPNTPPTSRVVAVEADLNSNLWAFLRVPKAEWRTAWPPAVPGISEVAITPNMMPKLFTTVVELIDLHRKVVLSRRAFIGVVVNALPGHRAAMFTSSGGIQRLEVWQFSVSRNLGAGAVQ